MDVALLPLGIALIGMREALDTKPYVENSVEISRCYAPVGN